VIDTGLPLEETERQLREVVRALTRKAEERR